MSDLSQAAARLNPSAPAAAGAAARPPLVAFIMSGGVGARLWPLSRQDFPKQFHDFSGGGSMLAGTVSRLNYLNNHPQELARLSRAAEAAGAAKAAAPQIAAKMPVYLIGAEAHAQKLQNELSGLPLYGGLPIFEPLGRNTAAAVALAAALTLETYGDVPVLVVPSDHEIETDAQFWQSIAAGMAAAKAGKIVIFGIKPDRPETGYGYIEADMSAAPQSAAAAAAPQSADAPLPIRRFVEKPDAAAARHYCESGNFLWNSGIFLFSAKAMQQAFRAFAPQIMAGAAAALSAARRDIAGIWLPFEIYQNIPVDSVDYAIMERARNIALVPARFRWNDLGSWAALLDAPSGRKNRDAQGNVILGDVVAIDCERSYLRSQSGLIAAVGLKNMAVVATGDATFIAPVSESQNVRKIVAALEKSGRLEAKFTPAPDHPPVPGAYKNRVHSWLFEETLPLWSTRGVDEKGGFYESLSFEGLPVRGDKRLRTMARQVYAFAVAGARGWGGPYRQLIRHGLDFMARGRTARGGFAAVFDADGHIKDPAEDFYDQSFALLALAYAHAAGDDRAAALAAENFAFIDRYLLDKRGAAPGAMGYFETPANDRPWRRANPHMHFLETCLAWHEITGDPVYLARAAQIIELFKNVFFDADNWSLGEYFAADWQPAPGETGNICEPGHQFEWASLLVAYDRQQRAAKEISAAGKSGAAARKAESGAAKAAAAESGAANGLATGKAGGPVRWARKLYASAIANGLNRSTGLAYNSMTRSGLPLDCATRSWTQTEAIKAAIALDGNQGPDLKPEVESRVGRLFRWHIEAAPKGLWIDAIDENGRARSRSVPASIFYHLVTALTQYMDFAAAAERKSR